MTTRKNRIYAVRETRVRAMPASLTSTRSAQTAQSTGSSRNEPRIGAPLPPDVTVPAWCRGETKVGQENKKPVNAEKAAPMVYHPRASRPARGRVAVAVPGFAGASGRVMTAVLAEMLYDPDYNPDYSRMGWRGAMLLCCLPFLLAVALGFYSVSESARWMLVKGRERDASEALHNLALKNGTEDEFPRGTALVPDPDEDASLSWCASGCDLDRGVSAAAVLWPFPSRSLLCAHMHA